MTSDEQLDLWVKGESKCPNDRGECCPDFSCCVPELLAPREIRELFVAADKSANEPIRMRLLGQFLGKMVATIEPEKKIYIAGLEDSEDSYAH